MLCLSGFELYSRWVPLYLDDNESQTQRKQTRRQRYRAEPYGYSRYQDHD